MAKRERALRKLIARLAEMPPGTSRAVLAQLNDGQQERVQALLDEYLGTGRARSAPAPSIGQSRLPQGLSPWLSELLQERGDAADPPIAPQALKALRACAGELTVVAGGSEAGRGIWQAVTRWIFAVRAPAGAP